MRAATGIVVLCLFTIQVVYASEIDLPKNRTAFNSLIAGYKIQLSKESGCRGLFNLKGDQTLGELLASFMSSPSGNEKNKHYINTRCMADKTEIGKKTVDTRKCDLTVTEEIVVGKEKEQVIATISFSVTGKDNKLLVDSVRCY